MFKVKIDHWIVQVKGKDPKVFVYKDKVQKKIIPLDKFEERGMILFPKELYKLITGSLKYSNTYDRFMALLINCNKGIIIGCFWLFVFYQLFQLWKYDPNNPFFRENDFNNED